MAITARTISRGHKLLGLVIGLQLLFWTASGLFFTLYPIEIIRGEHLELGPAPIHRADLEGLQPPDLPTAPDRLEVRYLLDRPVWAAIGTYGGTKLYDTATGNPLPPLGEAIIRRIALDQWIGEGELVSAELVEHPPREAFRGKPLWRAEFKGKDSATFWIDPDAGEVIAVRTSKWRIFDLLWRFHIMDVTGDDEFDTWWLKLAAFLGLTTVLFGFALLIQRAMRGRLFK